VVVGLGNPGIRYAGTRHNVGFAVVDEIARNQEVTGWRRRFRAKTAEIPCMLLVKPTTYMNLSGDCVHEISRGLGIPASGFVIVLDDLDLEPGRIRIRQGGGSGGHKGMRSIIERMGTDQIARIRVGVGRPPEGMEPAEYVLKRPGLCEKELLTKAIKLAASAAMFVAAEGVVSAMNRYNGLFAD